MARDWTPIISIEGAPKEREEAEVWVDEHPVVAREERSLVIRFTSTNQLCEVLGDLMHTWEVDITSLAITRTEDGVLYNEERGFLALGQASICISEPKSQPGDKTGWPTGPGGDG